VRGLWYGGYVLGLALNLGGVACALVAYARTFKLHGKTGLFPRLTAFGGRVRGFLARFLPFLRRDGVVKVVSGGASAILGTTVTADGHATIPADMPRAQQIAALIRSVEDLHQRVATERQERKSAISAVDRRLALVSQQLTDAIDLLDAKLYDVGVDSLRLQVLGALLVIAGTVIMAVLGLSPPVG
jgi:hypothetical protein